MCPPHQVGESTLSKVQRGWGSGGLGQVSGVLRGPFGCLQGSERVAGQDLSAGKVLLVLPPERVPGRRSCWVLHPAWGRGPVRARPWHEHTQPPAAATATRSCLLRGPLSPSWAPLGWGGEKPRPLAAPWPHQARAAPAPCPSPPCCHPARSVAAGQLCLLFCFPLSVCCGFPLLRLIFGWKHGFPLSCRRGASPHCPAVPRAGRLVALPARILHSFTSFR